MSEVKKRDPFDMSDLLEELELTSEGQATVASIVEQERKKAFEEGRTFQEAVQSSRDAVCPLKDGVWARGAAVDF